MTTKVTVDAHAGWPVEVKRIFDEHPPYQKNSTDIIIVEPNTVQDFHVWDQMHLEIRELPLQK